MQTVKCLVVKQVVVIASSQDGGSVESYELSDNLRYNVFIPRSCVEVLPSTEAIQ